MNTVFAVLAVLVLTLSAFAVVTSFATNQPHAAVGAPAKGSPLAAPSVIGANLPGYGAPGFPKSLASPVTSPAEMSLAEKVRASAMLGTGPTLAEVYAAIELMAPQDLKLVESVPASVILHGAGVNSSGISPQVHVSPMFGCISCAEGVGGVGAAAAVTVCVVGGVETLGTACLAALGAAALAAALAYVFDLGGPSGGGGGGASEARAEGQGYFSDYISASQLYYQSAATIVNLMGFVGNALAYEAANAVLTSTNGHPQVNNLTFNNQQDIVMSTVASQLANVQTSVLLPLAVAEGRMLTDFFITLGSSSGFGGYGCPVVDTYITSGAETTSDSCGGSTTGTIDNPAGLLAGTMVVGVPSYGTDYLYVLPGTYVGVRCDSHQIGGGSPCASPENLSIRDISTNHTFYYNGSNWNETNLSGEIEPINNYGSAWTLFVSDGIVLDNATYGRVGSDIAAGGSDNHAPQLLYIGSTGGSYPWTSGNIYSDLGEPCLYQTMDCWDFFYGGGTGSYASLDYHALMESGLGQLFPTVYTLAWEAGQEAQAYWTFLHLSGYTTLASIPKSCLIPFPSETLPSNIPPEELGNATLIYDYYVTYLKALASDFAGDNLNYTTFCHHSIPGPIGNVSANFNVYGLGYIYEPHYANNSNGTAAQKLGDPTTWNDSGSIFLMPSLFALEPTVNTSWEMSASNTVLAFIEPLVWNSTIPGQASTNTIADGPTECVVHHKACYPNVFGAYFRSLLLGNSTKSGGESGVMGSATEGLTPGNAVYFSVCYSAPNGSMFSAAGPSYTSGDCNFTVQKLTGPQLCNGTPVVYIDGKAICGGPTPPPPPPPGAGTCYGDTLPVLGAILDSVTVAVGNYVGDSIGCFVAWVVVVIIVAVFAYVLWTVGMAIIRRRD